VTRLHGRAKFLQIFRRALQYPLTRDEKYGMFEYACHEGNYALQNILRGARVAER